MKVETTQITKLRLSDLDALDPIDIITEDVRKGCGKITISCFGKSWTNFWGGMGDEGIVAFVCTAHVDYLADKLMHTYNKYEIDWNKVNDEVLGPNPSFLDGTIDVTTANDYDEQLRHQYGADWRMDLPERVTGDYSYLCRIIEAVQEGLRHANS